MTATSKKQIIAKATEMFMSDQERKGFSGLEDTQPEILELLQEGYLEKAKEELETTDQIRYALKQWEGYSESFNSKQISKNLKDKTNIISGVFPFDLVEAKDTGFFLCGTSQSGKTTLAKHLVKKIVDAGISVYVIDVSKAWTVDTPINNTITIQEDTNLLEIPSNTSAILDISQLSFDQRFRFVSAFTKTVYDWHKAKGYKKAPFEFIFYEEAHTYLPNGCFRAARKYASVVDLVTVGANFNLRFGAITQFPAALDKAVVKITQQRYFGWTTEFNDRNYAKSFLGKESIDPKNPDSIFNLHKGQFLYQLRNKIEKIQSRPYVNTQKNNSFSLNGQPINLSYNL